LTAAVGIEYVDGDGQAQLLTTEAPPAYGCTGQQEAEEQQQDMEQDMQELQLQVLALRASLQMPAVAAAATHSSAPTTSSAGADTRPGTAASCDSDAVTNPSSTSGLQLGAAHGLQRHADRMMARERERLVLQRKADNELSAHFRQLRLESSQLQELRATTTQALARAASKPLTGNSSSSSSSQGLSSRSISAAAAPAAQVEGPLQSNPVAVAAAGTFEGRLAVASQLLQLQLRGIDEQIMRAVASSAITEEPAASCFGEGGDSSHDWAGGGTSGSSAASQHGSREVVQAAHDGGFCQGRRGGWASRHATGAIRDGRGGGGGGD
jgi:hypothetical protein